MAPKDSQKWTAELTRKLIRFRGANEDKFLKSKYSAKVQWEKFLLDNDMGNVTAQQASKKWENLKKKYKDLKMLKSGSGTEAGETTAANWQYFEDMHEVLGSRPSVDPPVMVASFQEEDPTAILMTCLKRRPKINNLLELLHGCQGHIKVETYQEIKDIVEPSTPGPSCAAAAACDSEPQPSPHSAAASASPDPPPSSPSPRQKKRKTNNLLDYLKKESAKEQKRHEESETKTERLLGLFEKMIDKM